MAPGLLKEPKKTDSSSKKLSSDFGSSAIWPSGPVRPSKGGQLRQPTCSLPAAWLTAAAHTLAATCSLARPEGLNCSASAGLTLGSVAGGTTGRAAELAGPACSGAAPGARGVAGGDDGVRVLGEADGTERPAEEPLGCDDIDGAAHPRARSTTLAGRQRRIRGSVNDAIADVVMVRRSLVMIRASAVACKRALAGTIASASCSQGTDDQLVIRVVAIRQSA